MALVLNLDKSSFKLDLSKETDLNVLTALMNWDMHPKFGASLTEGFDPDLYAFLPDDNNTISSLEDVVYFKHQKSTNDAITLPKDNRFGEGEGESMNFKLNSIPANKNKVHIYVLLFEADKRKQHFGQMTNATVKLLNQEDGSEIQTYSLSKDYAGMNTICLATLERKPEGGWLFAPDGTGASFPDANALIAACYG
jgi:tellurium resistance protein TerD